MTEAKFYPGFWNGEPAKFRVVVGCVGPEPEDLKKQIEKNLKRRRFLWFEAFIGTERQMIEVSYENQTLFYIDNGDGSGLKKVLEGRGSPGYFHRSIYPSVILPEVEKENWTRPSEELYNLTQEKSDQYFTKKYGEEYLQHKKEMESLKEMIRKNGKQI